MSRERKRAELLVYKKYLFICFFVPHPEMLNPGLEISPASVHGTKFGIKSRALPTILFL